jgi:HK97 family phage portal protein
MAEPIEVTQERHGLAGLGVEVDTDQPQNRSPLRWFVFWELYRRNTWVRSAADKIVKRAVRDMPRLYDEEDPLNPDLFDLQVFLEDANLRQTLIEVLTSMLVTGRGYIYPMRTLGGAAGTATGRKGVDGFDVLDSRITYPITDGHGKIARHEQFYNGVTVSLEPEEVIYLPLPGWIQDGMGISPIESLVDALAVEMEAEDFNARLFANNLNMGVTVSLPDGDEAKAAKVQKILDAKHRGTKNAHRSLVLFGGAQLLKDGAATVKDIAFQILFELTRQKVATAFHVPVSLMLGDGTGTNKATVGILSKDFWEGTVRPLVSYVCDQFTRQFIREIWGSDTITMAESAVNVLPSSEEIDSIMKLAQLGMGFNEIRELMGKEALPNGDFPVMWTGGGYLRLDRTALPGLGDADITPEEAEQELMAAMAIPGEEGAEDVAPVEGEEDMAPEDGGEAAPEDGGDGVTDEDADAQSRVIDLTLSALEQSFSVTRALLSQRDTGPKEFVIRRVPVNPGARGGKGYFDANGRWHYGQPGAAKTEAKHNAAKKKAAKEQERAGKKAARERASAAKKAASEKRRAEAKAQRDKERAAKAKAREEAKAQKAAEKEAARVRKQQIAQGTQELRDVMARAEREELSEPEVLDMIEKLGWDVEADAGTPEEARDMALQLAREQPDKATVVMQVGGKFIVGTKPLNKFSGQADADNMEVVKSVQRAEGGGLYGTPGELTHPYMSGRIGATKDAIDGAMFNIWLSKLRAFTAKE